MSALGNALLRAAKAEPVPNGAEGRALAKLGVIVPVAPAAPVVPRVAPREASPSGVPLGPILASIAGGAIVAALLFANYTHSASPSPRRPLAVERVEPPAPSAPSVIASSVAPPDDGVGVPSLVPADPSSAPGPIAAKPSSNRAAQVARAASAIDSPKVDSLDLELALVREAKKRLEAGEPTEAIAALDRYAARFAEGTLAQEAAAVRVEALFASDDRATAIRAARLFFERYPASPYGHRIEALLRANR